MNYELSKKLKDAGFPQDPEGYELHTPDCKGWDGPSDCTKETRAVVPTLSELIEACEPKMYRLDYDDEGNDGYKAMAGTADNHFTGTGTTPEEAVANLWLALNKHSPEEVGV